MKKTPSSFDNNWQTLNLLSVEHASMIAGGSCTPLNETAERNTTVYTTSTEPPATIPSSTGRPPFN